MNSEQAPEDRIESPNPKKKKGGKKNMQLERLRIASEKLQFARIRTNLTLTTMGFVSYKYFFARIENGQKPLLESFTGRELGIFLISLGFVMLLIATVQHFISVKKLKLMYEAMPVSVSLLLSYLVLALGLFLELIFLLRL
jgi:uncharacterized membrane protein YidH (DUF202 family)